ncbi:hypothetical protein C8R46DRAFT_1060955, partial [Mycena filopes]
MSHPVSHSAFITRCATLAHDDVGFTAWFNANPEVCQKCVFAPDNCIKDPGRRGCRPCLINKIACSHVATYLFEKTKDTFYSKREDFDAARRDSKPRKLYGPVYRTQPTASPSHPPLRRTNGIDLYTTTPLGSTIAAHPTRSSSVQLPPAPHAQGGNQLLHSHIANATQAQPANGHFADSSLQGLSHSRHTEPLLPIESRVLIAKNFARHRRAAHSTLFYTRSID